MKEVSLDPKVAAQLERHIESARLEIVVGQVPASEFRSVEQIIGARLDGCAVTAVIEGSLASLEVVDSQGETRSYSIPREEALRLMEKPRRASRILIQVGEGILIEQCHHTGKAIAKPGCDVGATFLHLVRVPQL